MKLITFFAFFLVMLSVKAQVSFVEYYTKKNKKTKKIEDAYYSRLRELNDDQSISVKDTYLSNSQMKLVGTHKGFNDKIFIGEKLEGYENGKLKSKEYYSHDGKLIDTALYFYKNGQLKVVYQYLHRQEKEKTKITDTLILIFKDSLGNTLLRDGNGYAEFENSRYDIIEKGNFANHKRTGEWTGSFTEGKYTFTEYYENGKLLHGTTIDANGKKTEYDSSTLFKDPEYNGGMDNFRREIADGYQYPKEAIKERVSGTVQIRFVITKDGTIRNPRIIRDLDFGTGEAGVDVLLQVSKNKWSPGMIRGIPHTVEYTIPIRLNLNRH